MEADRKVAQVSWNDVWNWVADLEKCWHCYVEFQQWRVRKEGFYGQWDIRIRARWLGVGGQVTREEGVSAAYPRNDVKTLPGLQLRLCMELDRLLTEQAVEKASGAAKQERFA
jgi:hypothetical protein